jgi:hypothetical protein
MTAQTPQPDPSIHDSGKKQKRDTGTLFTVLGLILAVASILVTICACVAAITIPEIRDFIGLGNSSQPISVIFPTAAPTSTPQPQACYDFIDVHILDKPQTSKGRIASNGGTPNGEFMILHVEYKNLQTQALTDFFQGSGFAIAGQYENSSDWIFYPADFIMAGYYAFDNNLNECPNEANPGLWNECYLVFDIDPTLTNLYLALHSEYIDYSNACVTSWKLPE